MRIEQIGEATLYLADCMDVLPTLDKVDAVITDPPYGIGADKSMHNQSGNVVGYGHRRVAKKTYDKTDWDSKPPSLELLNLLINISKYQIIFGGNYFELPPTKCWLIWDKMNDGNNFADGEMAWTNLNKPLRIKRHLWNGFAREGNEKRFNHPTQKPLNIMNWCISQIPTDAETILDSFMGSGTTGVAAIQMGRKFIGIEREESYFNIACKRIEQATKQSSLFDVQEPQIKPQQEKLL